jgi:V8-like Glu-specific endopeptidase
MLGISSLFFLRKPFKRDNLLNLLRVVIVAMILCTIAFPAFARADSKTIVVKLWIGNPSMDVNGTRKPIDAQGTKPIILESRTLVPIRAIIEAFGGEIGWDDATKKVTINFNSNTLELWIGKSFAFLNGYSVQIDSTNSKVVPMIINGRTMIPLRFVAESFGIEVQYDDKTKMITLTYSNKKQLSITDIAKFVDRVVYIEVNGYEDSSSFTASGSGFLISSDGKILTNYHVIDHALSGTVTLNDKTKFDIVSVLGYSKTDDKDLAVIKINASNFPVCSIGDSSNVQVGESVVAIGSPLGLKETQNTVSNGIISKMWDNGIIQTTAPMSPGSSGGPLFNMNGEVIGVTEAGYPGGENLNLAVPINWLKNLNTSSNLTLEQVYLKENGSIPTIPGTPTLLSPSDELVLTTTTPTLTWTAVSGTDYYGVWIGKGRIADEKYKVWYNTTPSTSIALPSSILNDGSTYTWCVCAHNSFGFGEWSEAWHFSISVQQLTPPTIISPEDKRGSFPEDLSFQWSPVPGAISYTLEIYGTWVNLPYFDKLYTKTINQNSFKISEADAATYLKASKPYLYKWRVGAVNDNGTVWSEERYFTIIQRDEPYLMGPDRGEKYYANYSSYISFFWLSSSFATKYLLYIYEGTNTNNSSPILKQTVYSSSFDLPIGSLQLNKTYSWYVEEYYGEYIIGISEIRTFNIAP